MGPQGPIGQTGPMGPAGKSAAHNDGGIALGYALGAPNWLGDKENYAVGLSLGHFSGETAFAFSGIARLNGGWAATVGLGVTADGKHVGTRAGIRYGW